MHTITIAITNLKHHQWTHQHIIFKTCSFNQCSINIILLCSLFALSSLSNRLETITINLRAIILANQTLTAYRSRIPLFHRYSVLLLMHMRRSPPESIILSNYLKVTQFSISNRMMQQAQLRWLLLNNQTHRIHWNIFLRKFSPFIKFKYLLHSNLRLIVESTICSFIWYF